MSNQEEQRRELMDENKRLRRQQALIRIDERRVRRKMIPTLSKHKKEGGIEKERIFRQKIHEIETEMIRVTDDTNKILSSRELMRAEAQGIHIVATKAATDVLDSADNDTVQSDADAMSCSDGSIVKYDIVKEVAAVQLSRVSCEGEQMRWMNTMDMIGSQYSNTKEVEEAGDEETGKVEETFDNQNNHMTIGILSTTDGRHEFDSTNLVSTSNDVILVSTLECNQIVKVITSTLHPNEKVISVEEMEWMNIDMSIPCPAQMKYSE